MRESSPAIDRSDGQVVGASGDRPSLLGGD
jgi:hypothetical protein